MRYWRTDLSEDENRARFGLYANRHGHNYRLEVTLRGEPDPVTGMVINLTELKAILEAEVMARFDHRDLNDDTDLFEKRPQRRIVERRLAFHRDQPALRTHARLAARSQVQVRAALVLQIAEQCVDLCHGGYPGYP